jgi:hypothetical protein
VCEDVVLIEGRANALKFAMEGFLSAVATEREGLLVKKVIEGLKYMTMWGRRGVWMLNVDGAEESLR